MRNITYGFEHIEHRHRVLGRTDVVSIPIDQRINLNDMLASYYGSDYAPHPKLASLMRLNGGKHRHFLTGEEEVQAFKNNEFIKMHSSTLAKVGFFDKVIRSLLKGTLHTASKGWGIALDRLFESRFAKGVGFFGTIFGIALGLQQLWSLLPQSQPAKEKAAAEQSNSKQIPTPAPVGRMLEDELIRRHSVITPTGSAP